MQSFFYAATVLASTLTLTSATGFNAPRFDAAANTNLAVYWGQGSDQKPLRHFCDDESIDIIPIGFVNVFPDQQVANGYPGTNFGNACGGDNYVTPDGKQTKLLASCPYIANDIKYCQARGKKILLSLGGAQPDVYLASEPSATAFADFLWGAFGPVKDSWDGPRPFGDACVDGFDFDIESHADQIIGSEDFGYATMVDRFRQLFDREQKTYYISGAPQCIIPDSHLSDAIERSVFDFIFVQFYNTPQCSARAGLDHTYGAWGGPATDISFDSWVAHVQSKSANKQAKIYLGLPAAPAATWGEMYLSPEEAQQLIDKFQCKWPTMFGGVMLWEATFSENNQIGGMNYGKHMKKALENGPCAEKPTPALPPVISSTPCSSSAATESTSSVTSASESHPVTSSTSSAITESTSSVTSASESHPVTSSTSSPTSAAEESTPSVTSASESHPVTSSTSSPTSAAEESTSSVTSASESHPVTSSTSSPTSATEESTSSISSASEDHPTSSSTESDTASVTSCSSSSSSSSSSSHTTTIDEVSVPITTSASESHPTSSEVVSSSITESHPTASESHPTSSEIVTSSITESHPTASESHPTASESHPTTSETHPSGEHTSISSSMIGSSSSSEMYPTGSKNTTSGGYAHPTGYTNSTSHIITTTSHPEGSASITASPTHSTSQAHPGNPVTITSHVDVTTTSCPPEATACPTRSSADSPPVHPPSSSSVHSISSSHETTSVMPTPVTKTPEIYTTVIVTNYVGICPTGYTTISYTTTIVTTSGTGPTHAPTTEIPAGFTTTVVVCPQCNSASPTVTLTIPVISVVPVPIPTDSPSGNPPPAGSPPAAPSSVVSPGGASSPAGHGSSAHAPAPPKSSAPHAPGVSPNPTTSGSAHAPAVPTMVTPPYGAGNSTTTFRTAPASGSHKPTSVSAGNSGAEATHPAPFTGGASKATEGTFVAVLIAAIWAGMLVM